ncbi:hypothetical protein K457DRAFT_464519 [Linnemannia elongata AG-77]|uniref:Uncharacterized protein n=1 Tax=Linnemannia elongata AG-77 TaxID=1314771 RepID=A0A197JXV2_9FUNG|nr:hypothetical protein K457DRAFT_464519 [Linnemannia elongata AG-77]
MDSRVPLPHYLFFHISWQRFAFYSFAFYKKKNIYFVAYIAFLIAFFRSSFAFHSLLFLLCPVKDFSTF